MFNDIRKQIAKTAVFIRKHWARVAYYAGIAAALAVVAVAAEQYRAEGVLPETAAQAVPAVGMEAEQSVQQKIKLLKPEGMVLMRAYSDHPQWNEALGHWETHGAADYRCEGDIVRSVSDGVVTAIGKNGAYGSYIDVESGEYLLRYASVQPEGEIQPGTQVSAGETIGKANASMPGEGYAGAHLHLEIYSNGLPADPEMCMK